MQINVSITAIQPYIRQDYKKLKINHLKYDISICALNSIGSQFAYSEIRSQVVSLSIRALIGCHQNDSTNRNIVTGAIFLFRYTIWWLDQRI